METGVKAALRKGIKFARKLFSDKPEDTLTLNGNGIRYISNGLPGKKDIHDLKHVAIEQSFLGLFGSTISLVFQDGHKVAIRGLDDDSARSLKQKLDDRLFQLAIKTAQENLAKSSARVQEACSCLFNDYYLSAWQMSRWEEEYADLKFLCVLDEAMLLEADASTEALECRTALLQPTSWRAERNDRWINEELIKRQPLLDSLSKVPLTQSQREAILRHDNRVLAVAGAGTGKTTTVVGKVAYLLETGTCNPEEILLLSFSRGAVEELQERINKVCSNRVQVRTFHSLGLEVITQATGRKPAVFEQRSDADLMNLISNHLIKILKSESNNTQLLEFIAYYYYPTKSSKDFASERDFTQYVSSHDIRTLKGERVKSYQEAQIANWLYLQGVEYIYEAKYRAVDTGSTSKRVYKPDFYLSDYDIYIEHFGIDRDNNTAPWISQDKYLEDMQWKRYLHAKHRTRLIETFSYQATEGNLLSSLEDQLHGYDVRLNPRNRAELTELKELRYRLRSVSKLLSTALTLFKGDRLTIAGLSELIESTSDHPTRCREKAFLAIFEEVLKEYTNILQTKGEIDFGDMITEAARHVETGQFKSPFKVVIVDEFQDISRGRAWFMNALLEQVEDARLLCVGDDWQSIFRFTGSDINLMTDYERQWPQAIRIDLDKTFRFNNKIQEVSTKFITKNPSQLKKQITCMTVREQPAVHITDREISEITEEIQTAHPGASVLVLSRYSFNLNNDALDIEDEASIDRRNMTVHKAKGKEADFVIVDHLESGRYGFPTEMIDDPIINLFLSDADSFPNAEERRLFYVALTRARHEVWLRVNLASPSCFLEEFSKDPAYRELVTIDNKGLLPRYLCPKCYSGMVVRTNHTTGQIFLSCQNYPRCRGSLPGCPKCGQSIPERNGNLYVCTAEGCDWQADACPMCLYGFGELRTGRYGDFIGCSMFKTIGCKWIKRT